MVGSLPCSFRYALRFTMATCLTSMSKDCKMSRVVRLDNLRFLVATAIGELVPRWVIWCLRYYTIRIRNGSISSMRYIDSQHLVNLRCRLIATRVVPKRCVLLISSAWCHLSRSNEEGRNKNPDVVWVPMTKWMRRKHNIEADTRYWQTISA